MQQRTHDFRPLWRLTLTPSTTFSLLIHDIRYHTGCLLFCSKGETSVLHCLKSGRSWSDPLLLAWHRRIRQWCNAWCEVTFWIRRLCSSGAATTSYRNPKWRRKTYTRHLLYKQRTLFRVLEVEVQAVYAYVIIRCPPPQKSHSLCRYMKSVKNSPCRCTNHFVQQWPTGLLLRSCFIEPVL